MPRKFQLHQKVKVIACSQFSRFNRAAQEKHEMLGKVFTIVNIWDGDVTHPYVLNGLQFKESELQALPS